MNPLTSLLRSGRTTALLALTIAGLFAVPASIKAEILAAPVTVTLNPNGNAPLSAVANFTTTIDCLVQVEVQGNVPVTHIAITPGKTHSVPILGLYPGRANTVVLTLQAVHRKPETQTLSITTDPLPAFFPAVTVSSSNAGLMEPGMNLSTFQYSSGGVLRSYPFMYDSSGAVRWYLDLSAYGTRCLPLRRLVDGNYVFVTDHEIHEIDPLGKEAAPITVPGYTLHDEIIELPNGNFLAGVDKPGTIVGNTWGRLPSRGDYMIEVDRSTQAVLREIGLINILDVDRNEQIGFGQDGDWFHMSGIAYRASDDSFITSGRYQAIVRVLSNNNLQWILAASRGWFEPGWPEDYSKTTAFSVLRSLNPAGQSNPPMVQGGYQADPNFDWPWGPASVVILSNGNLLVYDGGYYRFFMNDRGPYYSRAVEYAVDENNFTVRQVWAYGLERGQELYSPLFGNAQDLAQTHNRLMGSGMVQGAAGAQAKAVEVTYPGNTVVFEAAVMFRNLAATGTAFGQYDYVYQTVRLPLYPNEPLIKRGN
ncbi:MAG: aryl-sulfate sulfotransferase [Candidatus Aminicenantales bacterium]|jgi:arylsulfate sulfotransferase